MNDPGSMGINQTSQKRIRAVLLGDRIDTANLKRDNIVSTSPLTYRTGADGLVTLFRYGVAVLTNMSAAEEDETLRYLSGRIIRPVHPQEEEIAHVEVAPDKDEQIPPGGPIVLRSVAPERMIIIADALSKSVVLARDEREVSAVFEVIEPLARELADHGRSPGGRRTMLKHIGKALLVHHRVSGRVAVAEKPDVVWDRHDLERLYARVQDEYELKDRAETLSRKLAVIAETAQAFTDIIDTNRALRLEAIIVLLIAAEIVITGYQILTR